MRKTLFLALILAAFASVASAQTTTDELGPVVFVGYSNLQAEGVPSHEQNTNNSFDDRVFGNRAGLHGVNAAVTGYVTPRFGITGDFSFNQRSRNFGDTGSTTVGNVSGDVDTRVFQFMGGPQVRFPNQTRVTPFARVLFGVANTRFEVEQNTRLATGTSTRSFNTSSTDFAMAVGGGLDVRLNERVGLRLLQVDYNPVFLRDRSINVLGATGALNTQTLEGQRQDNIRLGFGVTFK